MTPNKYVVENLKAMLKDAEDGKLQGFVAVGVEVPKSAEGVTDVSKIRYVTAGDVDSSVDLVLAGLAKLHFEIMTVETKRSPVLKAAGRKSKKK